MSSSALFSPYLVKFVNIFTDFSTMDTQFRQVFQFLSTEKQNFFFHLLCCHCYYDAPCGSFSNPKHFSYFLIFLSFFQMSQLKRSHVTYEVTISICLTVKKAKTILGFCEVLKNNQSNFGASSLSY